jgi:hypothetical protein
MPTTDPTPHASRLRRIAGQRKARGGIEANRWNRYAYTLALCIAGLTGSAKACDSDAMQAARQCWDVRRAITSVLTAAPNVLGNEFDTRLIGILVATPVRNSCGDGPNAEATKAVVLAMLASCTDLEDASNMLAFEQPDLSERTYFGALYAIAVLTPKITNCFSASVSSAAPAVPIP